MRSFPEAREFLSDEILGPDYPTKHLIEQARTRGFITRGKRGRGAEPVSSSDMAALLCASLAGDTPQSATDALEQIQRMYPDFKAISEPKSGILNFGSESCRWNFIDMIAAMIDVCRKHYDTDFEDLQMTIIRIPALYARLSWNRAPLELEEKILYKVGNYPAPYFQGKRRSEVSFNGNVLAQVGDWLENRTEHP